MHMMLSTRCRFHHWQTRLDQHQEGRREAQPPFQCYLVLYSVVLERSLSLSALRVGYAADAGNRA